MRLGLIARCDGSGLGTQTLEAHRHLKPAKTLLINVGHLHNTTTHCNKRSYPERYPDATVFNGWEPDAHLLTQWLRGLDAVFGAETFYSDQFIPLAKRMGVRTVLQPNYEFLRPYPPPDMLAVPSLWHWDEIPEPKIHLPVPIALDRFGDRRQCGSPRQGDAARCPNKGPRTFLHTVGRPAIHDRNGTPDVLAALRHVKSDIRLILRCQDASYLQQSRIHAHVPTNVEVVIDSTDVRDYWDNYTEGDVLILPRRYGGLCLPVNEALGAGMPVIMTDISPNNEWLPSEWLTPAVKTAEFMAFNRIDVFQADPAALAEKIDAFASDDGFYAKAKILADELAQQLSWQTLLPEYEKILKA
jgi:glycosyltransferase involved in cell wall biosynthesis